MALGAAGGSRIPSSIVAVISRVIDQNHSLEDAMRFPRVHPTEDNIEIELISSKEISNNNYFLNQTYSLEDSTFFINLGHQVKYRKGKGNFGRVYAVMKEGDEWIGVSDPDWQGNSGAVK